MQWPGEIHYYAALIAERWRRLRDREDRDLGATTLEYIVMAAVLFTAVVGASAVIVGVIKKYQGRIK